MAFFGPVLSGVEKIKAANIPSTLRGLAESGVSRAGVGSERKSGRVPHLSQQNGNPRGHNRGKPRLSPWNLSLGKAQKKKTTLFTGLSQCHPSRLVMGENNCVRIRFSFLLETHKHCVSEAFDLVGLVMLCQLTEIPTLLIM